MLIRQPGWKIRSGYEQSECPGSSSPNLDVSRDMPAIWLLELMHSTAHSPTKQFFNSLVTKGLIFGEEGIEGDFGPS